MAKPEDRRAKLAREMTHRMSDAERVNAFNEAIAAPEIRKAIDVGMGRMSRDVAYGEKPLAGGFDIAEIGGIPINATDLIGTGIPSKLAMGAKMFAAPLAAALGGTAIASKASQGANLNALANLMRKERGIFAGVNAKTADLAKLEEAKQLAAQGVPDAEIWKQTGWTLDTPDKMPRFEIPDNTAKLIASDMPIEKLRDVHGDWIRRDEFLQQHPDSPEALAIRTRNSMRSRSIDDTPTLDQIIDHPELFQAYPELRNTRVAMDDRMSIGNAGYSPERNLVKVSPMGDKDMLESLLHEGQHVVQEGEKFAGGGSPSMFNQQADAELARDALSWRKELLRKRAEMPGADWMAVENAAVKDYQQLGAMDMLPPREARDLARQPAVLHADKYPNQTDLQDLEELVSLYGLDKRTNAAKPMDLYQRLGGEAEARQVPYRMNLTPEQRLAQYPYEPQYFEKATGVPLNSLIVRRGGGDAMSVEPTHNEVIPISQGRASPLDEMRDIWKSGPKTYGERANIVRNAADEFASRFKDEFGYAPKVIHSGSSFGPSSYIEVDGYKFRISDHGTGVRRASEEIAVYDEPSLEKALSIVRKRKADIAKMEQDPSVIEHRLKDAQRQKDWNDELIRMRLKSADKKLLKGKPLTVSEQEAVDMRNAQSSVSNSRSSDGDSHAVGLNQLAPYLQDETY